MTRGMKSLRGACWGGQGRRAGERRRHTPKQEGPLRPEFRCLAEMADKAQTYCGWSRTDGAWGLGQVHLLVRLIGAIVSA